MTDALRKWLLVASLVLLGCGADGTTPRTQMLVAIDGGPRVRMRADTLRVKLWSGPRDAEKLEPAGEDVFEVSEGFTWPATLALLPKGGDASRSFRLLVTAEEDGRRLTEARVSTSFVPEQTLLLELLLEDACIDYFECSADETCKGDGGVPRCVSATVDSNKLPKIAGKPSLRPRGGADDAGAHDASTGPVDDSGSLRDAGEDAGAQCASTESCTNGRDDDCDGDADCADADCSGITQCVPAAATIGVLVDPSQACPPGYTAQELQLHTDLIGGVCEGCACGSAGATSCTAQLLTYPTSAACTTGTYGDTFDVSNFTCLQEPLTSNSYAGWGVGAIVATPGSCPASGTAKPQKPSWGTSKKLCITEPEQNGCDPGHVCVPTPSTGSVCRQVADDNECAPAGPDVWYQGYSDTRSCGTCDCTPEGASCSNVQLKLGDDWSCEPSAGPAALSAGQKNCDESFPYSPPAYLMGSPTNATCKPSATLAGALTPTKPLSLCCTP